MLACLSPNGMNRYDGASAPDRLLVATSSGVTTLARESSGAWRKAGTSLAGLHATTLTTLPGRPGIFVGTHGDGVFFSGDGARWEERNSGFAIKDVYTVASVAEAGGISLYATLTFFPALRPSLFHRFRTTAFFPPGSGCGRSYSRKPLAYPKLPAW